MYGLLTKERRALEIMLILVCIGLTCLLYVMQGYKMVILDLFFLPIVLAGFFLGRYHAGILALFCVISASCVAALRLADLAPPSSPLVIALAVTVWAAVLGLTALLIGTLSDDRTRKVKELHDAYVGVVEVLTQYLQNADPHAKTRSIRVAELSQQVAMAMKLTPREIDDVRVAALLYDVGNIEITTRVIRRAVGTIEDESAEKQASTFQGTDLMLSLGSVLSGAVPLLLNQEAGVPESGIRDQAKSAFEVPAGAQIIRATRAYCTLADSALGIARLAPTEIVRQLRDDCEADFNQNVLRALEQVALKTDSEPRVAARRAPAEPVEIPEEMTKA